jgi:hypothetical protein
MVPALLPAQAQAQALLLLLVVLPLTVILVENMRPPPWRTPPQAPRG